MEVEKMDLQKALNKVGGWKRYHLFSIVALSLSSYVNYASQMFGIVFTGWAPDYHCRVPYSELPLNQSIPVIRGQLSKCSRYVNISIDNTTEHCVNDYHYYNDGYTSIFTEFNLVCQKDFLVDMSQILFTIGMTIAGLLGSVLSDTFGRKRVHFGLLLLSIITGSSLALAPNYTVFLVLRTVTGALCMLSVQAGSVLMLELFGPSSRLLPGVGVTYMWAVVMLIPCLLAYFIQDWRILQLVCSLVALPCLALWWVTDESAQWLCSQKRYDEAQEAVRRMARLNGLTQYLKIEIDFEQDKSEKKCDIYGTSEQKNDTKQKLPPTRDLFCDTVIRMQLLICIFLMFSTDLLYAGLILSSTAFGSNRFLNYLYLGLVEFPACVLMTVVIKRWGRRLPLAVMYMVTAVPLAVIGFIPQTSDMEHVTLSMSVLAKFGITACSIDLYFYSMEIFPTTIRAFSSAWLSIGAGLGSIVTPIAAYQARKVLWLPNLIFACFALSAALVTLKLPETANKPLPGTTHDVHRILYNKHKGPAEEESLKTTSDGDTV